MQIAIGLYPGFTALDAIGPYQVFTQVPGVDVVIVAERTGRLSDDNGLLHFDMPTPDLLLVPGGFITRQLAVPGEPIVEWIRGAHPHTTYTTSVCTGALLLGAAGVLEGLPATTHWIAYDDLASFGAFPTEARVVTTGPGGKIVTGAGVSAGIDLALTLAGRIWGDDLAKAVQLGIEYDPQPPYDSGAPSKASTEIVELVRAVSGTRLE